ncbi:MAG: DegT/DnrJ/EryC1/StrS family aminotransferase, partial [Gammaproteobacteria bacterium]|nr:DegT/DnrJ/EryC1/StrS family aminotransferase [Gammaproteobacteria bacterium]
GSKGVETLIHYPLPPHLQKAYESLGRGVGDYPIAEAMANQVLSLPMGPHLDAVDQQEVIKILLQFSP